MEMVTVGDSLTAEVNDVKGSISDPVVEFTIKKSGIKAIMPTKNLSMTERLALTSGSIMQGNTYHHYHHYHHHYYHYYHHYH
jgi:hypothetical protein